MNWNDRRQLWGMKFENFVYKTAIYWMLFFILAVFSVAMYIKMNVWYECRTEHSFFYCLSLIST